jgi:hypothetical protein
MGRGTASLAQRFTVAHGVLTTSYSMPCKVAVTGRVNSVSMWGRSSVMELIVAKRNAYRL